MPESSHAKSLAETRKSLLALRERQRAGVRGTGSGSSLSPATGSCRSPRPSNASGSSTG